MPRGASVKRENEYEKLKGQFKKEGRYKGREEEVASRIVNKQRSELGETKQAKEKDRKGQSPDRNLPIDDYEQLPIAKIQRKMADLSRPQIQKLLKYEKGHKNRKSLIDKFNRELGV